MNTADKLSIGALAVQTDCSVPTIRYYEEIGLLPPASRSSKGHRHYSAGDVRRLAFIKRCRDFGFPIDQVRALASLLGDEVRLCDEVRDLAQVHLTQVRARLREMQALEANLTAFICSCNSGCLGGAASDCRILDEIADACHVTELRRK